MRRSLVGLVLGAMVLAVGCQSSPTPTLPGDAPRTTAGAPAPRSTPRPAGNARCAGVTIWGCTAHTEVAASSDCDDLQSWFDAADQQRAAYLRNNGSDDPNYKYALDVMMQADARMQAVGCYG